MARFAVALLVVAVIAAVVLGLALVARASRTRRGPAPDDPREILRRRYAAGEIDEDEYLRRMSGLSQDW
ncbi:SHOCT domain-containing protein [Planomonospora sp. ID91781]|uniref:SHOCT domain-containing protein n=1 Tax=Planomonospora sp. ID91781 TaxID=2738135 RepID=UPI0018C3A9F2|nr:SHOCT domain-containing protein [Planomonospora sp. ID91781]MBG0824876.1 SHOCT domain-containing protein [Planomonospora sp. ID91781]